MLLALIALLNPSPALAAEVPDCWTVSGKTLGYDRAGREIEDGVFNVTVDSLRIPRENLVRVLDKADNGNLRANSFPLVFDDAIIVSVAAVDYGAGPAKLTRARLQANVTRQVAEILAIPGVEGAECSLVNRIPEDGAEDEPKQDEAYEEKQDQPREDEGYPEEKKQDEVKHDEPMEDQGYADVPLRR